MQASRSLTHSSPKALSNHPLQSVIASINAEQEGKLIQMSQINHKIIGDIKKHFHYLLEKGFSSETDESGSQDWVVRFYNKNCFITFFKDRYEIFVTIQSRPKIEDGKNSRQSFELEVVIAYLTQLRVILRGPQRKHEQQKIDAQIEHLGNIFASYQDQILSIFEPDTYLIIEPEILAVKDKIDDLYIQFIKSTHKD